MANGSIFPEGLDTFNQILKGDTITSLETNRQSSAIERLERKVGIDDSQDEDSLDKKIATETGRATTAEQTLQSNINSEASTRGNADNTLQENIEAETARATDAEETIAENLSAEVTRATAAEADLQSDKADVTDLEAETTRATEAEETIAENLAAEVTRATGVEALKANVADVENIYIKKSYALNNGSEPTYQMLKAITWNTDSSGHIQLHAWLRDLSGITEADIEDDFVPPLASPTADGIMPKETFATVADLVNKVSALLGAIIPRGEIPEQTAEVTQEILTQYIEDTYEREPQSGDGIKDADNLTWVYNGGLWIKWGNDQVGQATNDDDGVIGSMGIVKGKNADGYAFVESDGTLSVVGWDAFKAAFNTHVQNTSNPHGVTKAQVGLSNADNTSDADKPVSAATQTAITAHTGNMNNPHSVTKAQVGLGNVDNTADANKPVSTAQAAAIAAKQDKIAAGTAGNVVAYSGTAGNIGSLAVDNTSGGTASSTSLITSGAVRAARGAANGVAPLGADSKVPLANLPEISGGGSGLDQTQQNIINEQNGMSTVPQANGMWDSLMSDDNVVFNLAANYAQGSTTIKLNIVQPDTLDEFKQKCMYPFCTQIYDTTNKSYMVLTGDDGNGNFTLAAPLVNMNGAQVAYSTSGSISKLKMLTAGNGTGTLPSDLIGQAAALPENLNVKYLPNTLNNKTLQAAINFNPTKQYKITDLPDAHTVIVQSDTDDSSMFPVVDVKGSPTEMLAYSLINNQFKKLTLTAAASYSSPNLTFTVAENTAGLSTLAWYAIKSPVLSARVEDISQAGELVRAEISSFTKGLSAKIFRDNFDRANSQSTGSGIVLDSGGWTKKFFGSERNWTGINNNAVEIFAAASAGRGGLYLRNTENITSVQNGITVSGKFKAAGINVGAYYHLLVVANDINSDSVPVTNTGIDIYLPNGLDINFALNGTDIFSQVNNIFTSANVFYNFKIFIGSKNIRLKGWPYGATEPIRWNIEFTFSQEFPAFGYNYSGFGMVSTSTGEYGSAFDDFELKISENIASIRYSLPAQTGNKLTTSIALPINSANESPMISGLAGYLG
jgi:hypothetical protein